MVQRVSYPIRRNGAAMLVIRSVTSLFGLKRGVCRHGGRVTLFIHFILKETKLITQHERKPEWLQQYNWQALMLVMWLLRSICLSMVVSNYQWEEHCTHRLAPMIGSKSNSCAYFTNQTVVSTVTGPIEVISMYHYSWWSYRAEVN